MKRNKQTFGENFDYCPYCVHERANNGCAANKKSGLQVKMILQDLDFCMPSACLCWCSSFVLKPGIDPPPPWYDPHGNIAREYAGWKERTGEKA